MSGQLRRGIDYEDPVQDVIPVEGPLTLDVARQLAERGVSGVKVDASVPRERRITAQLGRRSRRHAQPSRHRVAAIVADPA
jgi:hypothetical protein